jgi:hypothetical protein
MKKYFFDFKWQPTRRHIMASYRLSADKHSADQPGENHVDAGAKFGVYGPAYRQQLKRIFRRIRRTTDEQGHPGK